MVSTIGFVSVNVVNPAIFLEWVRERVCTSVKMREGERKVDMNLYIDKWHIKSDGFQFILGPIQGCCRNPSKNLN